MINDENLFLNMRVFDASFQYDSVGLEKPKVKTIVDSKAYRRAVECSHIFSYSDLTFSL